MADQAAGGAPASSSSAAAPTQPASPSQTQATQPATTPQTENTAPAAAQSTGRSQIDSLMRQITHNKGLRHEDDLSTELGIVGELGRRQDFDFQLLLAKRRLGMREQLQRAPKGMGLEQLVQRQAGGQ
eukprot:CAMPEP_0202870840 /NCGR_PEP_ID=MMETSP1391-20130828/16932_1 /ASSEMBLY_ACC=CAM_ASM_000867 /TAXON_ID=1034604 /ORGANISM="Chlamydomonas leiostraca, Strain SAG 11-49" /LENGTH=127 /DNA_ID=CAMNT_0049551495 /DNA_START=155 /DNA_END=538 /DNA_ORIENTATION=-